jgi:hypothetical protein
MIGFNYFGRMGQLGNQMFQLASLKGIARNNGYNFCIPNHNEVIIDNLGNKLRIEIFNPFNLKNISQLNLQTIDESRPSVSESGFSFDENLYNNCPDWVNVVGYLQTEKYFKNIESEIKEDFSFKNEILDPCKEMISQVENPISLHIRRGDFLINSGNHHNLSLDYYETSLSMFENNRNVIIFSDDSEWCKEQELFRDDRFLVAEGNSSYVDLCLMSLCSEHIIANSTFSWWGAWLANSNRVIAPRKWFGPNNSHLDTKDLYPETWEIV